MQYDQRFCLVFVSVLVPALVVLNVLLGEISKNMTIRSIHLLHVKESFKLESEFPK